MCSYMQVFTVSETIESKLAAVSLKRSIDDVFYPYLVDCLFVSTLILHVCLFVFFCLCLQVRNNVSELDAQSGG